MALIHEVDEAAGAGDDDISAAIEGIDLWALADSAIDAGDLEAHVERVFVNVIAYLRHELTGGGDDERADAGSLRLLSTEEAKHRKREGGGLTGAGLSDAGDVALL